MKHFTIKNGRLAEATYIASPNFNQRPTKNNAPEISGIVIHNISLPPSQFGQNDKNGTHYVKAFFQNQLNPNDHTYFKTIKDLQVSAHLFIERDGNITQFVNFNDRAWHAGQSSYLGRQNCNDFTIGIELEGVINIEVNPDSLLERLSGRIIHRITGETFHKVFNPPVDYKEEDYYQREDDKPETVKRRLDVNIAQGEPIIAYYRNKGLVHDIQGNKDIDEVFADIEKVLTNLK